MRKTVGFRRESALWQKPKNKIQAPIPTRAMRSSGRKNQLWKDCVCAFLVGGLICTFGELLKTLYTQAGLDKESAGTLVSVTLVFLTAFFTGIGWFDSLARIGGAGTLVPITGFANSVVSPALDNKADESAIIYPSQTNLHNLWGEDDSVQK